MTTRQVDFPCYQDFGWPVSHTNPNKYTIFQSDYRNHQIWLNFIMTDMFDKSLSKKKKDIF